MLSEIQQTQSQYYPQKRINDNYLPAQNTLSDNFLQQTFLSDTNSFVQYQKLVHQKNPKEIEALNQYYASLPPQQKQFVRPNPSIEFKEEDLPLTYSRFKIPKATNMQPNYQHKALFDNDATLFSRNILTLCENSVVPPAPTHLKNYINMLGGIEDTIASNIKFCSQHYYIIILKYSAMENSLKHSELKNLEDKYINYYVHYLPNQPQEIVDPLAPPPNPPANPFSRRPCDTLNTQIPLVQPQQHDQTQQGNLKSNQKMNYIQLMQILTDGIREDSQEHHQNTFQQERSQINPIIEQSKKLREERMKFLQKLK